ARTGQYVCKADGSGTQCNAVAGAPTTEICDGKDNDCDGERDEDNVCGHLGDVVWLEGATPQNHYVLVGGSTYDFSIYLSYNIATTSSAIILFSLMTNVGEDSWLGAVTYVVSGAGQVYLTLTEITIPPDAIIVGAVYLFDLNMNLILPSWWWLGAPTLSYVSGSTSSVYYLWIKDENPERGVEFQEGQTVTITLNVEYNALSYDSDLNIVAFGVEGEESIPLAVTSISVVGQGVYQFTLTFNVRSCWDSIQILAYMGGEGDTGFLLAYEVAVYPVKLTTGPCLRVRPTLLYFNGCEGGVLPPPENVYIASISSTISSFSASLTPSVDWITLNPSSGSTLFMSSIGVYTTGLTPGSYSGEVTVWSSNAKSSKTIKVFLNIITAPSHPTGVVASSMLNSIQIIWGEIGDAEGYYVYRATNSGGPYTRISSLIPSWWASYLDLDVQCGVTYYYKVSAKFSCGEVLSDEVVSAQVEPQPEICDGLDNNCDGQIDEDLDYCYSAIYNPDFGAPLCRSYVSPCSSGALLAGRDDMIFNPERNRPNTLDECTDGTSYFRDESLEEFSVESLELITLTSLDPSGNFVAGGEVTVEFVVWCETPDDYLDVYYASGVTIGVNPNWQYLSTYQCPSNWSRATFSHTFTLDNTSGYHAVRGVFRYQGSSTSCSTGELDEADDIVFPVHNIE
ncbi:MAG: MopE-related protein, partial [Candidatus Calescibacterium sp.]